MEGIDWSNAAEQLLRHWQRSGITHLPVARNPLPEEIAAWTLPTPPIATTPPIAAPPTPATTSKPAIAPASAAPKPAVGPPAVHAQLMLTPWESAPLADNARSEALKELNEEVKACRKCTDIVCRRIQTVFGIGPLRPRLVMVGEAPGADEDRAGEPFVGAAGQLLDKILVASGLAREQVYIMNTLKCRPPGNRTPVDTEIDNCRPFFERQLEVLQPEYIICWGSIAARAILRCTDSVGRLRGRFHSYKNAKVMVTYHPSYLLRTPEAKHQTWDDMKMLMRELGITPPPR
jgi:uracil-DNA glycosylase family 4